MLFWKNLGKYGRLCNSWLGVCTVQRKQEPEFIIQYARYEPKIIQVIFCDWRFPLQSIYILFIYLFILFVCSIVLLLLYKLATNSVSQRLFYLAGAMEL